MATKFYLRNDAADVDLTAQLDKALSVTAGASQQDKTTSTVAGPTAGVQVTDGAGGTAIVWWTVPLNAVTISGAINMRAYGRQTLASANVGPQYRIFRCDGSGAEISEILNSEAGSEFSTIFGAKDWSASPTSTTLANGDRIKVVLYGNDAGGNMANGFSFLMRINTADATTCWVQFSETINEYTTPTLAAALAVALDITADLTAPTYLAAALEIPIEIAAALDAGGPDPVLMAAQLEIEIAISASLSAVAAADLAAALTIPLDIRAALSTFNVDVPYSVDLAPGELPQIVFEMELSPTVWTDFSDRLLSARFRRGRSSLLEGMTPGTLEVRVDNHDGVFSPWNEAGAHYEAMDLGRRMRLRAVIGAEEYPLAVASVKSFGHEFMGPIQANQHLQGVDVFERFGKWIPSVHFGAPVTLSPQGAGERILTLLSFVPWGEAETSISAGEYEYLFSKELNNQSILDAIGDVVKLERGLCYIDGRGYVVFQDKFDRLGEDRVAAFGSVSPSLPVATYTLAYSDEGIYNHATTHRARYGEADLEAEIGDSIDRFGRSSYHLDPSLADDLDSDGRAANWVQRFVNAFAWPRAKLTSLTINPNVSDEATRTALWYACLTGEPGKRLVCDFPERYVNLEDYHIAYVDTSVDMKRFPGSWRTVWGLELREGSTY